MKHNTSTQELGERIERIVREYISDIHVTAEAALERALAGQVEAKPRPRRTAERARSTGKRRASADVAALGERFYEAVCEQPGEAMTVLAPVVGATARELHRAVTALKHAGRILSVGSRNATRYFPMLGEATAE